VVNPTTTLAIETGNNTSAADGFKAQSNGNAGAGNVSKMPIRSLLYSGATTKIYASFEPWFGGSNHMNVGYDSTDPTEVHKQVLDMISRGCDGAISDWYGFRLATENTSSTLLLREAELHSGFEVAMMLDGGMIQWGGCPGCTPTQAVIEQLNYAAQNFYASPAYMKRNGRPLVFEFGLESYTIDWSRVLASIQGNPMIIWEHQTNGFDGRYSWIEPGDPSYLDWFYGDSLKDVASKVVFGSAFKGFNDTLASWSANRILSQNCGQEWLNTFAIAGKYYSSAFQLPNFQVAVWNDYEEGTEIETGIDNCVSVAASLSGSSVAWRLTGNENTVDHYTVFISIDGQNLMALANPPAGTHSLDLSPFGLGSGSYTIYVKAIGKASMTNHMSGALSYAIAGSTSQPPTAVLSLSPNAGTSPLPVTASTSASTASGGSIVSSSIDFGDGIVLGGPTATHTYNTVGAYTVIATVYDNQNVPASAKGTVTVSSTPPSPSTTINSVNITSPLNGSRVANPVHVTASATAVNGPIKIMQVYVGGNKVYEAVNTASIDTYVTLGRGRSYSITIQAYDANYNYFYSIVTVYMR